MKRLLLVLCCFFALGAAPAATDLPVVCYHDLAPNPQNIMTTTPELFARQMDYLAKEGYRTIGLEEASAIMSGQQKLVGKPILLTFDDGYGGVYRYALPVLKKHGFKATIFLVVSKVGVLKPTEHLTWKELEEMRDSGVFEFGSHSYAMHIEIPESLKAGKISLAGLQKDLARSREVLEKHLGRSVRALAWPYGHYDSRCLDAARKAGFKLCFGTDYGRNRPGDGVWDVRRIRLSSQWDDIARMRQKLDGNS